jgi:hypothetical protein
MEKRCSICHLPRLDRLLNRAAALHSLRVALGCIREEVRLLSLQDRCRPGPGGGPYRPCTASPAALLRNILKYKRLIPKRCRS